MMCININHVAMAARQAISTSINASAHSNVIVPSYRLEYIFCLWLLYTSVSPTPSFRVGALTFFWLHENRRNIYITLGSRRVERRAVGADWFMLTTREAITPHQLSTTRLCTFIVTSFIYFVFTTLIDQWQPPNLCSFWPIDFVDALMRGHINLGESSRIIK